MIRKATLIDVPTMLDYAERFHVESHLRDVPINRDKLARVIPGLIDYKHGLALVAERGGQVIGGMLAVAEAHFFSDALFSFDLCTFVVPEHRGGFTGIALLRRYARWAQSIGVHPRCINGGVASGITQERTIPLFERAGFVQTGVSFNFKGKV